jgi:hypothetical protein
MRLPSIHVEVAQDRLHSKGLVSLQLFILPVGRWLSRSDPEYIPADLSRYRSLWTRNSESGDQIVDRGMGL